MSRRSSTTTWADTAELGDAHSGPTSVPHGDTVGVAAADGDGYAVSLIQSVYHAFGSGLIDPVTGILFHDRGTGFRSGWRVPECDRHRASDRCTP